jgi:hypothetical protein
MASPIHRGIGGLAVLSLTILNMKSLKLLLFMLLAALGAQAQQMKPDELRITISSKKASMPYNKILVDVEMMNISSKDIKLLNYFNDKEHWKRFFTSYFSWSGEKVDSLTGEKTYPIFIYGGGGMRMGIISIGKPEEALKYITLKPQQAHRFRLNLSDLFRDLNEIRLGLNQISLTYGNPRVKGCDWCLTGFYTSNRIEVNVTK